MHPWIIGCPTRTIRLAMGLPAIDPDVRRVPFTIPPTLSLAHALTSLTPLLSMLTASPWTLSINLSVLSIMLFTLEKSAVPFLTIWMDTASPPQHRTQTYQLTFTHNPTSSLSKNAGLLVPYTNCQTPPQTTFATNLKQHTNSSSNHVTPLDSTSVNPPPYSTLAPTALTISRQAFLFYCWRKP